MMNLLIEKAPDYIVVRGKKIKIETSFDVWVRFIVALKQEDEIKIEKAFNDIFGNIPHDNIKEVIQECMNWMSSGDEKKTKESSRTKSTSSAPFDFEIDGNVIYCELWEHFPHLMERGITYHEGIELIKLLMHNENTIMWHRAFARCGDFSKMDKERKQYWMKQRAIWVIPNTDQKRIDDVFATAF